ncbi:uncharacterized protein LOC119433780 [Dermacentor silvarum]|uniref:uncharacterized protein LOC119433780 n=1 Tax=Dermacentor silvarum TaxID=543639 RepID=UPI002101D395|nr:uncharacterized protein LOC119433780 [Dermacentor silvarum]
MPLPQPPQSMQKRATHGVAERSARMEHSRVLNMSPQSACDERTHGTARHSSKEPLHLWNVAQCSTYDDEAQSDLPGFRPSESRTTTPSSGHYECRNQPQEQEYLGLERHQRTSTHACSPFMAAPLPRKEFQIIPEFSLITSNVECVMEEENSIYQ